MGSIKSLVKETAVYGLSSIVGRFLNWCLVPLYVYTFPSEEYGVVSYLYSFTAVMLVILNYGMETGFFRFANKEGADSDKVYTTSLISVGFTSLLFVGLLFIFIGPVSRLMLLERHPAYILMLGCIVAADAFTNLPFAYLRFRKRAFRFAGIKLANVGINIALNLFFLLACPAIQRHAPGAISWFYEPLGGQAFGIGWIFVANVVSTLCVFLLLLPEILSPRYTFDGALLRSMLKYSWPLLVLGVAGIASQNMGQLMIPYIFAGHEAEARSMVGIYGANIKIAIVMVMFTQAFRYAYEPFIFAQARNKGEDTRQAYSDAMKFFVIFGLVIFLAVMYYLPFLKHFVSPGYWSGLRVVPIMMAAELFFGVFFNLSLWYKLTDRTQWGMYFSLMGFALMFGLNLWLVNAIGIPDGYMGSAWAALISYGVMMVVSYLVGRRYMPISYPLGRLAAYTAFAAVLWFGGWAVDSSWAQVSGSELLPYLAKTAMLLLFVAVVVRMEKLPLPRRLLSRSR